jgi:hypothetical protein
VYRGGGTYEGISVMPNNWVTLKIVVCTGGLQFNVGVWVVGIVLFAIVLFVVEVHVSIREQKNLLYPP